jgi:anti-sigma-K factor RskA
VDRELTRAELDDLLPLYALDALEGEEREQVVRYLARDDGARAEVASLREAVSWLPSADTTAPDSLWSGIERGLEAPAPDATPPVPRMPRRASLPARARRMTMRTRVLAALAAAGAVVVLVLGVQVVRQQHRIDDLAAEMHHDPMQQQAASARSATGAHVIPLDAMDGGGGAEIVMLPDGTGYLMNDALPALRSGSTYQLWAQVGGSAAPRMVSLGVLGRRPGIAPFRLVAAPTMFEVTEEPASGSDAPSSTVVLRGDVA